MAQLLFTFYIIHRKQQLFFRKAQRLLLSLINRSGYPFIRQSHQFLTRREALTCLGGKRFLFREQREGAIVNGKGKAVLFAIAAYLVQIQLVILPACKFAFEPNLDHSLCIAERAQSFKDNFGRRPLRRRGAIRPEISGVDSQALQ